ncbi:MAG: bifunctional acetate--CoA ligase family protein/GNAT family N-acetyltransferase [Planctomycetales bacterium]|nr:bifunctional acetate--CoA ligase family protein/GNAT family N-acetyltransferase [Planctomycetales bacterium]
MSIRHLEYLFHPKSIAVIGASQRHHSVGGTVMRNLLSSGFEGPVLPVNPKYRSVAGVLTYNDVSQLPLPPDMAVICTPPATVPEIVSQLGELGTKAAVVLTAGMDEEGDRFGRTQQQLMLEAARPNLMRILGPNCVGLVSSVSKVNASFVHTAPLAGELAFLTQSGALSTAVLDWAKSNGIGLSHFVSVGNSADIDFGDLLDYLASDSGTSAILMYIESIKLRRKFMSAARAAARNKPVLAVKAGRVREGALAAASHTGALAGSDMVYDAALRRAGILRVESIEDLFNAVETLARARPLSGERLAILTNGGGPGVMATDMLIRQGGTLATLNSATIEKLDAVLPANWSHINPIDVIGDATAERYAQALQILLEDNDIDAVLVLHAPTALVSSQSVAEAVVNLANSSTRTVLTCWLGKQAVADARRVFAENRIPSYESPEDAITAFLQMVHHRQSRQIAVETPRTNGEKQVPDTTKAREVIEQASTSQREWLTEPEAKKVLEAYGIPTVRTLIATSSEEAAVCAHQLGFPVAVKILSPDIVHKSDIGGVALDLDTPAAVTAAASRILRRAKVAHPDAEITGLTVQQMVHRTGTIELIIGVASDATFGPVILFGHGGTATEVIGDRAVALPPLNLALADEMVQRTRIAKLLAGYRDRPPANMPEVLQALVRVSHLVVDFPEIQELDINPLLADHRGVIALDARIRVQPATDSMHDRLAILPYPRYLEESQVFDGMEIRLRPIRPDDEAMCREFSRHVAPDAARFQFAGREWTLAEHDLPRNTQIDFNREMAIVAVRGDDTSEPVVLGVVRGVADPDNIEAEFAIIVHPDFEGKGLGKLMLDKLARYYQQRGTTRLVGRTSVANQRMIALARHLDFETHTTDGDNAPTVELTRFL